MYFFHFVLSSPDSMGIKVAMDVWRVKLHLEKRDFSTVPKTGFTLIKNNVARKN